jgi:hypothetical protein
MADDVLGKTSKQAGDIRRLTEIHKTSVKNNGFVQVQELRGISTNVGDIVGNEDNRDSSLFVHFPEQVKEALSRMGIQGAGRFIENQKIRIADNGLCQQYPLLLTAESSRSAVPEI